MSAPLHRPLLGLVALTLAAAPVLLPTSAQAADPVNTTTCNAKPVTQVVLSSATASATGTPGDDVIAVVVDRASTIAVDALAGNDTVCVVGQTGYATVDAGEGNDVVSVAAVTAPSPFFPPNTVLLGAGNDSFVGSPYSDVVQDTGAPQSGDDSISTGAGYDRVTLTSGVDQVDLGAGGDYLEVNGDVSGAWVGGADPLADNTLVIDSLQSPTAEGAPKAVVDLRGGALQLGAAPAGSVSGFSIATVRGYGQARVVGTDSSDTISISACRIVLDAGTGDDSVDLDSYRRCDSPSARAHGSAGNDTIRGAKGDDRLYGDGGRDRLYGRGGADLLVGGGNNDKLYGDRGNDVMRGGGGRDRLQGDAGFDVANGGNGRDTCSAERRISC